MRTKEYKTTTRDIQDPIDSRYFGSDLIEDTGMLFRGTYSLYIPPLKDTDTYTQIRAGESGRLDLVAYRTYKNPRLYWVIAQANGIINPIEEAVVGLILRIPKYTESLNVR